MNQRPPDPQSGALPGCATLRTEMSVSLQTRFASSKNRIFYLPEVRFIIAGMTTLSARVQNIDEDGEESNDPGVVSPGVAA